MMTKKKTPRINRAKFAWTLPIVALLLFAFAEPEYRYADPEMEGIGTSLAELPSNKTIKMAGLVLDENSEPMPGVSVVIKGTNTGRVSDRQGKFELEIPENASIVLSFVGKTTLVESFAEMTSGKKNGEVYMRKYQMKDEVISIGLATNLIPKRKDPPPPPPPAPIKNGEKEVFYIVEELPHYPGGSDALNNYVYKMQKKFASEKNAKGKAKVLFTVDTKGKVNDIKVIEKDNDSAAKGAYIIAKEMKDWTPGKQRGKPVPVKFLLPIEFR